MFFFLFLGIFDTKQWTMKGLLILIRHGDRGPLQHVRNISGVNCGTTENDLLHSYKVCKLTLP